MLAINVDINQTGVGVNVTYFTVKYDIFYSKICDILHSKLTTFVKALTLNLSFLPL